MAENTQPIVVVTGASRGIGKAIATRLLEHGGIVHGTYNTAIAEALALEAMYPDLKMHQVDLADQDSTRRLLEGLSGIPIQGLVNNAGVFAMEDLENFDFAVWDRVFAVNLHAPLRLTLGLLKQFVPGASIVNVSSVDGLVGSFASMAYSASKAALINLTKSLGNNLGKRDVRVNAIAPGWINTGMATEESHYAASVAPMGRNGTPDEVASLAIYLLANESSFINGETVVVDGGLRNVDFVMMQESRRSDRR